MRDIYLNFVRERHRVFERRQAGEPGPWTDDPILQSRKFTNVFRAIDFGSQYLIRELLYGEDEAEITYGDMWMRCFLYRYTNRPEPWDYFYIIHGRYPVRADLEHLLPATWREYRAGGGTCFGTAFKMFSGAENKGTDRLTWAMQLTLDHFGPDAETVPLLARASSMQERLDILRTIPRCADFMAMQIVTDAGYSRFVRGDENDMVLPGPGAKRGAAHVGPSMKPIDVIYLAQREIEYAGEVTLKLPDGRERAPSLMDIQNTLCEFSKYARYLGDGPARSYRPAHPGPMQELVLPEHW